MASKKKIDQLRDKIDVELKDRVGDNCILIDAPYYDNIGDVLIWNGVEDFLKENGKNLVSTHSIPTFSFPKLDKNLTILLTGGGNFGDLWRYFQEFRLKVIQNYPDNRILMFPQSVWYEDANLIEYDRKILEEHPNMLLCARDQWSFDFMTKHFPKCDIRLVPDMAFYISDDRLEKYRNRSEGRKLFFKRIDKEKTSVTPANLGESFDVHDWPTVEKRPKVFWWLGKACGAANRFQRYGLPVLADLIHNGVDKFAAWKIKDGLLHIGADFLAPYDKIVTTRLHAMILSILLHKELEYIDNTTGKLSAFANTWLSDLDSVKPYKD